MRWDDIDDKDLRAHIRRELKRSPESRLEDLLLATAEYDREFSHTSLRCLGDFVKLYHSRGRQRDSRMPHPDAYRPEAPYHLLATLRLDGNEGWEKRSIIYLDECVKGFNHPEGEVMMRSRTLRDENGDLRDTGWYSSEVGIETLLNTLDLSGSSDAIPAKDDQDLTTALQDLNMEGFKDKEQTKTSKIEVVFERIMIGHLQRDVFWKNDDGQHKDEAIARGEVSNVTHVASRNAGAKRKSTHDVQYFDWIDEGELYAKFTFYYRSAEKLRTMFDGGISEGGKNDLGVRKRNKSADEMADRIGDEAKKVKQEHEDEVL
jgi:hypothetical protein